LTTEKEIKMTDEAKKMLDFPRFNNAPRLLMQADLKPLQGGRFQPTGFADLGAARYTLHDGTEMLLLESAQSVANRMELACCRDDKKTLLDELAGLPYVAGRHNGEVLTTSYLEAHRLSSPYLLNQKWAKKLSDEMQLKDDYQINDKTVVKTLFKYDPCCLLHGVWLGTKDYKAEFSGGRIRLTRTLSGFIEAEHVIVAESGGTKFDKNAARLTETGNAETGYGTLPFHRTEFTAEKISAYFNLDLAMLRGYGLSDNSTRLLIALALFKVRRFLSTGLRLRTACDLQVKGDLTVTRPEGFAVPSEAELLAECTRLIAACKDEGLFADPPVTEVVWAPSEKKPKKKGGEEVDESAGEEDE
jgi:CRISPR-associated protein Csb1